MYINKYNPNLRFTSKNSPIEPYDINLAGRILHVEELQKPKDFKQVAERFRKNEVNELKHSTCELSPEDIAIYNEIPAKERRNDFLIPIRKILAKPDGNSTILIAKNERKELVGFVIMQSLDKSKDFSINNIKIGCVEAYINHSYSQKGLGSALLNKISKTANGYFTDVFAKPFYLEHKDFEAAGYNFLDRSNQIINDFYLKAPKERKWFMTLSVDSKNPWWGRIAKSLK